MRLFTGISIPEPVRHNVSAVLDRLRPLARLGWVPAEKLHITTKFIGEWPEERLEELMGSLQGIAVPAVFEVRINGFGWFPNPHSPRVLWCGIQAGPELAALASATDQALAKLGIQPEKRAFSPHLTLARIKDSSVPLLEVKRTIATLPSVDMGTFVVQDFLLFQSVTKPGGSVYTPLQVFPLAS
jgi:RNA 2',3'-cyclic 3'-phosphodiesterase